PHFKSSKGLRMPQRGTNELGIIFSSGCIPFNAKVSSSCESQLIWATKRMCFLRATFRPNILGASHPARKRAGHTPPLLGSACARQLYPPRDSRSRLWGDNLRNDGLCA